MWRATRSLILLATMLIAGATDAAARQQREVRISDVTVRLGAPVAVEQGDTVGTLVVVGGPARIDGTVAEQLVVIGDTTVVSGEVVGGIVIVGGGLDLRSGATVGGDVVLYESAFERSPDAEVAGLVREPQFGWAVGPLLGLLFWIGATVLLILVGLLFAWIAGRQLEEAARLIPREPGATIVTALIVVIGLPIVAILSFFTIIGIPLGLTILTLLLPILLLLGHVVTGAWIGAWILGRARRGTTASPRSFGAVALGLVLLQLLLIVPILGALVLFIAPPLGAGALVYRGWRNRRRAPPATEPS